LFSKSCNSNQVALGGFRNYKLGHDQ
jgi:hypothetical protein